MSEDKLPFVLAKHPTGSSFICDPPVTDTDEDWVVLVDDIDEAAEELSEDGWADINDSYRRTPANNSTDLSYVKFYSLRKGRLNWIITDDPEYYDRYVAATLLAKQYNLRDKAERIQLFTVVIDGEYVTKEEVQVAPRNDTLRDTYAEYSRLAQVVLQQQRILNERAHELTSRFPDPF